MTNADGVTICLLIFYQNIGMITEKKNLDWSMKSCLVNAVNVTNLQLGNKSKLLQNNAKLKKKK